MAEVELLRDTVVRFAKGTVLEVPDAEASRLIAFKTAIRVEEEKTEAKTARKKK